MKKPPKKAEKKERVQNIHGHEAELVAIARISRLLKPFDKMAKVRVLDFVKNATKQEGTKTKKDVPPSSLIQV